MNILGTIDSKTGAVDMDLDAWRALPTKRRKKRRRTCRPAGWHHTAESLAKRKKTFEERWKLARTIMNGGAMLGVCR